MTDSGLPWFAVLGHALIAFVWQGAVIGGLAFLVLRALRRARPEARYVVCGVALVVCALMPLANVLWFSWDPAPRASASDGIAGAAMVAPKAALVGAQTLRWVVVVWLCGAWAMLARLGVGLAQVRRWSSATVQDNTTACRRRRPPTASSSPRPGRP